MISKKIYTSSNLENAKLEYENFIEKYKGNKKLIKKVNDNIEWIYQLFDYPTGIRKVEERFKMNFPYYLETDF